MLAQQSAAFAKSAPYYDLFYASKDYDREAKAIASHLPPADRSPKPRLVEFGCGTCQYARRFQTMGYNIVGVEPSNAMELEGHKCEPHVPIVHGLLEETFHGSADAVLALFAVFSYAARSNYELDCCLNNAAKHLRARGGRLIFDFLNITAISGNLHPSESRRVETPDGKVVRRICSKKFDGATSLLQNEMAFALLKKDGQPGGGTEVLDAWTELHCMRAFSEMELRYALAKHGFGEVLIFPWDLEATSTVLGMDDWYGLCVADYPAPRN